jgi:hypothetical protein
MAVGLWAVLRISINSWARGTEAVDANQRNRSILDLVRKQIGSTYGLMSSVDPQTGGNLYPLFAGAETSMQFISLSSLRFLENPGLTIVSYDFVQGPQGEYALVEKEARYLGLDPAQQEYFDRKDEHAIVIFDNLVSFRFEYFDSGDDRRPAQWVGSWNARELLRLPMAVSMSFVVKDPKAGSIARQMVIPILARPNDPRLNLGSPFNQAFPGRGI